MFPPNYEKYIKYKTNRILKSYKIRKIKYYELFYGSHRE